MTMKGLKNKMKKLNTMQKIILGELGFLLIFWIFFSKQTIIWMSANAVVNPYPFEMSELVTLQLIVTSVVMLYLTVFAFHKDLGQQ